MGLGGIARNPSTSGDECNNASIVRFVPSPGKSSATLDSFALAAEAGKPRGDKRRRFHSQTSLERSAMAFADGIVALSSNDAVGERPLTQGIPDSWP